jgi:hypothetical protein
MDNAAPAAQGDSADAPEEVESAMLRDAPAESGDDPGFWADGGSIGLVLLALTALFLVLAMALRFRSTRKS